MIVILHAFLVKEERCFELLFIMPNMEKEIEQALVLEQLMGHASLSILPNQNLDVV